MMSSDSKQTILITGGNTGLGLEAVRSLLRTNTPYNIIIGSRTLSNGKVAISLLQSEFPSSSSTLSTISIDLESDSSIAAAGEHIQTHHNGTLDILINNGGANLDLQIQSGALSFREGWNKTWSINVTGTMLLTHTLIPYLLRSQYQPRLLFITSGTSSLIETESQTTEALKRINASPAAGWPKPAVPNPLTCYRSSKAGMNMAMREWARILKDDGVKVFAVSPGFLATGLAGIGEEQLKKMGALDPSVGGEFIKEVVQGERDHDAGKAIRADMIQPW